MAQRWVTADAEEQTFRSVLADVARALDSIALDYVVIGGLATMHYARPRDTKDIDLLIRESDGDSALAALEAAGFETERPEKMNWLYKARKDDILIDLIFRVQEHIVLDDEMIARANVCVVEGTRLRLASPEDFLIMQAVAHSQDTPHYWVNALETIGRQDIDWSYIIRRARTGARRVLSLLLYAQSEDLAIPDQVVQKMFDDLRGAGGLT